MTIYYAVDRSPPCAKLIAFTVREARDGYVDDDRDHRERLTQKDAAHLCKQWHGQRLEDAVAKGVI